MSGVPIAPAGRRLPYESWSEAQVATMMRWFAEHRIDPYLVPTWAVIYLEPAAAGGPVWVVEVLDLDGAGRVRLEPDTDRIATTWIRVPYRSDCPWPTIPA
jgi:hypothetical protein